jgi:hypothetical protein
MKNHFTNKVKTAALLIFIGLFVAGCAPQTGRTSRSFDENWRFVPPIHADENSFGVTSGITYQGCSYDQYYDGYWCPKR